MTEFLEQAKLHTPVLNVIAINVSRHIKSAIGEAPNGRANGHQSGKQKSDVLLGSDLDPNCLQRLSADNTSRHSHLLPRSKMLRVFT